LSCSHNLKIAQAYNLLCDFIVEENYNQRLLLYLPFELIPDYYWEHPSPELSEAINRFRRLYRKSWRQLLSEHDYRANFVDGDILEPEIRCGKLSLVAKAAHLAPILVPKGLVSIEKIFSLIENSTDAVLKNSLMDSLLVINNLKLLTAVHLDYMQKSEEHSLHNLAIIIKDDNKIIKDEPVSLKSNPLPKLISTLKTELAELNYHHHPGASLARIKWEKEVKREKVIEKYADTIVTIVFADYHLTDYLQRLTLNSDEQVAILLGICSFNKLLLQLAAADLSSAQDLMQNLEPQLNYLWQKGNRNFKKPLEKLWLHCESAGIISGNTLTALGIKKPSFDSQFNLNQDEFIKETPVLSQAITAINSDSTLSTWFYPVFTIYGSKIKGYGSKHADLDIAVFIKPGTPFSERPQIQSCLQELFQSDDRIGRVLEFWLIKDGFGLWIKDWTDYDRSLGNSTFAHVFFNGVYFGKKENINFFYEKLMISFLHFPSKDLVSQDVRTTWLQEIERDLLQYRLMHKGYAQARPKISLSKIEHTSEIDADSSFWEAGYRQVASKLFVSKVFLPQL